MKTVIILSVMLVILVSGKAQVLDNSGPIQVGKTTTAFLDSLIAHGYTFKLSNNLEEHHEAKGKNIYKPQHDPKVRNIGHEGVAYLIYHERFKIGELQLWGITFHNLELEFYRDTLFALKIPEYPEQLKKLLLSKYGEPKLAFERIAGFCANHSDTIVMRDERYRNDVNFTIAGIITDYYDNNCNRKLDYVFIAAYPSVSKFVSKKESEEVSKKLGFVQ